MPEDVLPDPEDVALREEISPKERLDALLESPFLTRDQAAEAMDREFRANQATFPHLVIATVMVSSEQFGSRDTEFRAYTGPFSNRLEAERWANRRFADNAEVTWEVEKVLTPEMDDRQAEQLRRIIKDE